MTSQVVAAVRKTADFQSFVERKMSLGSRAAADLGNLYTAALPAWMAAGFEEAAARDVDLAGKWMLAVGYGSGDAAEAIPLRVSPTWARAARRIGVAAALAHAVDLDKEQYESLHDTKSVAALPPLPGDRFRIARVGTSYGAGFQDLGVEYYEYLG